MPACVYDTFVMFMLWLIKVKCKSGETSLIAPALVDARVNITGFIFFSHSPEQGIRGIDSWGNSTDACLLFSSAMGEKKRLGLLKRKENNNVLC